MRRIDRMLRINETYKVIDECEFGVFSALDGSDIFSVPISLVRDDKFIYIHGAKSGSKEKLFKDAKEVTIVCVSYANVPNLSSDEFEKIKQTPQKLGNNVFTTEYKSAILQTKAFGVLNDDEKIRALRLLCEKYTPKYMDAFEVAVNLSLKRTNIYKFEIISLSGKAKILKEKEI